MAEVFTSTHHPGDVPAPIVYGRALAGPLGFCTLPVMIAAAAAALQQTAVLPFLTWGLPAALAAATLWTRFRLGAIPAELHIRPRQAAVLSVHECLRDTKPDWQPIYEVRDGSAALIVTVGYDTHRLPHSDWPAHRALLDALRTARTGADMAATEHVSSES